MSFATDSGTPLTPSEEALLNGADLVPKGGMLDKFKLVGSEAEVSKKQLAGTVYASAFLGAEEAGELRLELRATKAMLGLRTTQSLYAEPVSAAAAWPAGTFEADLPGLAKRLSASKGQNEVSQIVYEFLHEDTVSPLDSALQRVYGGLSGRGLLTRVEEKKLGVFKAYHLEMQEGTARLARDAAPHISGLLEACRTGRPDIWKAMLAQIESGFTRRRLQQDMLDTD